MEKVAVCLFALFIVTGFSAAAHSDQPHAGDHGGDAVSDTPNAGKTAGPEATAKTNNTGPEQRSKGIQNAISNVPDQVANTVLTPIQNFDPGQALGDALKGVGGFFQLEEPSVNETVNTSEDSQ